MAPMHLGDPEALGARAAALASGTKNVTRSTTQVERVTGTIVYDCRKCILKAKDTGFQAKPSQNITRQR